MPAGRIATVPPVSEAAATGKVAAIYADIKQTKKLDAVPNFWRVLATNPDHLEMIWTSPEGNHAPGSGGAEHEARPDHP